MLLLGALFAGLSLSSPSSLSVAWQRSFQLTGRPEVRVATNNADVRVRASGRKDIEAIVYTDKRHAADVRGVTHRQSGNLVELDVQVTNQWRADFGQRSVVIELRVPVGSDINAHCGDGSVSVQNAEGRLVLRTDNGNVEALGIDGTLSVESGHGDVHIQGTATAVDLKTQAGNIAAQIDHGSKMQSAWTIRTGDGNVDFRLPDGFPADLDVHTGHGNLRLELPIPAAIGGRRESSFRQRINGGNEHLEIRSERGDIMVGRTRGSI